MGRSSESSVGSSYYDGRRRSSAAQRFGNLEALKRRQDEGVWLAGSHSTTHTESQVSLEPSGTTSLVAPLLLLRSSLITFCCFFECIHSACYSDDWSLMKH